MVVCCILTEFFHQSNKENTSGGAISFWYLSCLYTDLRQSCLEHRVSLANCCVPHMEYILIDVFE